MTLTSKIVQTAKQKIVPATVIDVLGSVCSVKLSNSGQTLKNLVYYGPKPAIGDSVLVDYTTSIPVVTTTGSNFVQNINQTINTVVGSGSIPSNPSSPSDHNSLSGIQGGVDGQYYHLTADQIANIGGSLKIETSDDDEVAVNILRFNLNSITELAAGKWAVGSGVDISDSTPIDIHSIKTLNLSPAGRITNNGSGVVTVDVGTHVYDGTTTYSGVNTLQFGAGLITNPSGNVVLIKDFWQAIGATRVTTVITLPTGTGVMAFGTAAARATISNEDATYFMWVGNAAAGSASFALKADGGVVIKKGNISLGSGDNIVRMSDDNTDNYSLWVGAAAAAGAPFKVLKTGEVWLQNFHLGGGYDLTSPNFVSGVSGWEILQNGNAEFNNIVLRGQVKEIIFAKETLSGVAGQMVVTIASLITVNVLVSDTTITIADDVLIVGDVIHLKSTDRQEWMYITSTGSIVMDGYTIVGYSYNVTRDMSGDGAKLWYIGESIFYEGNAILIPGTAEIGYQTMEFGNIAIGGNAYTVNGGNLVLYGEADGPYFGVNRRTGSDYEQMMAAVRLGNLYNYLDVTAEHYGLGVGDSSRFLRYTYEDGLRIRTASGGTIVDDEGITTNSLNIIESPPPAAFVEHQATLYVYNNNIIVHYNNTDTVLNKLNGLPPVLQSQPAADRVIQLALNGTIALVASDMASVRIPDCMIGMNLISVAAHCGKDLSSGASSSGNVVISVQNNITNMLSTNLQIDAGAYDSSSSVTPAVIDLSHDDIAAGNIINVEIVSAGTGVTYLIVTLVFRAPTV